MDKIKFVNAPMILIDGKNYMVATLNFKIDIKDYTDIKNRSDFNTVIQTIYIEEFSKYINDKLENEKIYIYLLFNKKSLINYDNNMVYGYEHRLFTI